MRQYQKGLKSLLAWVWWKLFAEGSSELIHIALQDKSTCCLMSVDLSIFSAWILNQSNISSLISAGINAIQQSHIWDNFPYIIQYSQALCWENTIVKSRTSNQTKSYTPPGKQDKMIIQLLFLVLMGHTVYWTASVYPALPWIFSCNFHICLFIWLLIRQVAWPVCFDGDAAK